MLVEIHVKNFVLIEDLHMAFGPGLNVITGETGAGKSIIIDALGLLMGERVKNDYIRDKSHKANLHATFDLSGENRIRILLEENGFMERGDDLVMISRELDPQGKNQVRINGRLVPLALLKKMAPHLLDIHVQYDNLSLLHPGSYLELVDGFITGAKEQTAELAGLFMKIRQEGSRLEQLRAAGRERQERIDLLRYQIEEIERASPWPGEEEDLSKTRERVKNVQQLTVACALLQQLLYHSPGGGPTAYDLLYQAAEAVRPLQQEDLLGKTTGRLEDMCYAIEEMSRDLSRLMQELEFEPGKLEEIENRLYELKQLQKKYGGSIQAVMDYAEQARQEVGMLAAREDQIEELAATLEELEKLYYEKALAIRGLRKEAALLLEEQVRQELAELNMPHIQFTVEFKEKEAGSRGIDEVEFMFSPNPGEPLRPLARIASGGEISRFVLALKKALAAVYMVPTLIFDEIDIGVGGAALQAMAGKLEQLGASHQVLLVTHAPQIASRADGHYLIAKEVRPNHSTVIGVKKLEAAERIREVARMLGGENISPITLQHAEELLRQKPGPGRDEGN